MLCTTLSNNESQTMSWFNTVTACQASWSYGPNMLLISLDEFNESLDWMVIQTMAPWPENGPHINRFILPPSSNAFLCGYGLISTYWDRAVWTTMVSPWENTPKQWMDQVLLAFYPCGPLQVLHITPCCSIVVPVPWCHATNSHKARTCWSASEWCGLLSIQLNISPSVTADTTVSAYPIPVLV